MACGPAVKSLSFALVALSLTACAGQPRVIERPTPIACVTGDVPDEPPLVGPSLSGDSGTDIGIIAASAIEVRAWGRALLGIVNACRDPHQ